MLYKSLVFQLVLFLRKFPIINILLNHLVFILITEFISMLTALKVNTDLPF